MLGSIVFRIGGSHTQDVNLTLNEDCARGVLGGSGYEFAKPLVPVSSLHIPQPLVPSLVSQA